MKFVFEINSQPKHPSGVLRHDLSKIQKRPLAGIRRQEAKDILKTTTASVYRRQLHGKGETDKVALDRANYTEVQTPGIFRVARVERNQEEDFDRDVFTDLLKRKENMCSMDHLIGRSVSGFIQELSHDPFYVSLYSERQLKLLHRFLSYNPSGVLHLDATGSVTTKLPEALGSKTSYYYALVILLPGGEESPCVPVQEFVTNQHFAGNLFHVLHYFLRKYAGMFQKDELALGIKRMETDASRSLISAVLQALEIGRVDRYMNDAWRCLANKKKLYYVHHICRSHSSKFIGDQIKAHLKTAEERETLLTWRDRFLFSRNLREFCRRVQDVVIICGTKKFTAEVQFAVANIARSTPSGPNLWSPTHIDEVPDVGPLYATSPFSNFAIQLCHDMKVSGLDTMYTAVGKPVVTDDLDDLNTLESDNPYFSIGLLRYLIQQVFSLGCLYDHSLLYLNGYSITSVTNAGSEAWNKLLKVDEMSRASGMKVGRFATFAENILRGRINMFEEGLKRVERRAARGYVEPEYPPIRIDDLSQTPETSCEIWKRRNTQPPLRPSVLCSVTGVQAVKTGFEIESSFEGTFDVSKCVNIDACLQILYTYFTLNETFKLYVQALPESRSVVAYNLIRVFELITDSQFHSAKRDAMEQVLHINPEDLSPEDFVASEIRFIQGISVLFPIHKITKVKTSCPMSITQEIYPFRDFSINNVETISTLLKGQHYIDHCELCKTKNVLVEYRWSEQGVIPILSYAIEFEKVNFDVSNICESIVVIGSKYQLFAYTYIYKGNFYAVYFDKSKRYFYNGNSITEANHHPPAGHKISTVWYAPD